MKSSTAFAIAALFATAAALAQTDEPQPRTAPTRVAQAGGGGAATGAGEATGAAGAGLSAGAIVAIAAGVAVVVAASGDSERHFSTVAVHH